MVMNSSSSLMLEVRDLNKKFGEFQALKDLSFEVKRGEILGFLGPNGAGKTTTMRIITCYLSRTSGSVRVAGFDIENNDLEVRKRIGYLPETTPLYNDMTVTEYLKFVAEIRGLFGAKALSRIDEMFQVCGLTKMARRQIGKLSKGYRQRVGLAQAMLHDPELLILDEPTSGLDPNQIIEIRQLIKRLGKEKTIIYCSHILPEVSATCSRIVIINKGTIVANGTPEELTMRAGAGNRYFMRIKGAAASDAEATIRAIPGISGTSIALGGDEWIRLNVFSEEKEDMGEQLYKCAVNNGWILSELRRETATLEEVFTQLTRG